MDDGLTNYNTNHKTFAITVWYLPEVLWFVF
jgi:hypothetical protein